MEVLKQMATEPVVDHVKHALTVEGINTFKNALASQICKEAEEKSSCDSAAMDLAIVLGTKFYKNLAQTQLQMAPIQSVMLISRN